MDSPADLRIQAAGWRLLAQFYGSGAEALLETAGYLDARASRLERQSRSDPDERPRRDVRKRA
jgi:hypothetical protein